MGSKKSIINAQISGKLVTSGISNVATALSDCYYYEKIARNDVFSWAPEIDFRYETKARKVMVDFKFHALYR